MQGMDLQFRAQGIDWVRFLFALLTNRNFFGNQANLKDWRPWIAFDISYRGGQEETLKFFFLIEVLV
jgi:hypothetical protein